VTAREISDLLLLSALAWALEMEERERERERWIERETEKSCSASPSRSPSSSPLPPHVEGWRRKAVRGYLAASRRQWRNWIEAMYG
jgi:hypothetical protein